MDIDPWNWLIELPREDLEECLDCPKKLQELWDDFLDSCRNDPYELESFYNTLDRILRNNEK